MATSGADEIASLPQMEAASAPDGSMICAGHISPTVAQITALSKMTGCKKHRQTFINPLRIIMINFQEFLFIIIIIWHFFVCCEVSTMENLPMAGFPYYSINSLFHFPQKPIQLLSLFSGNPPPCKRCPGHFFQGTQFLLKWNPSQRIFSFQNLPGLGIRFQFFPG